MSLSVETGGAAATVGHTSFIVLKFGGTSVSSAENWHRIKKILESRLAQPAADGGKTKVLMVHSALSKVHIWAWRWHVAALRRHYRFGLRRCDSLRCAEP